MEITTGYVIINEDGTPIGINLSLKDAIKSLIVLNSWDASLIQYWKKGEMVYSILVQGWVSTHLFDAINFSKVKP